MSRVAYVNGRYLPHGDAVVHIEDRGYQLADGVYEVWAVFDGQLADEEGHFARLGRSLGELQIEPPMTRAALKIVLMEVLRRNRVRNGIVYLQVTRGTAPRNHAFPNPSVPASVVVTARPVDRAADARKAAKGIGVITTPENRWGRCDIKTVGLLPNVLAKQAAAEAGAGEAWFVDGDGLVTEGASSNAWIIDEAGVLRTRDLSANILRGITRSTLMEVIKTSNLKVEERAFTPDEARRARGAFITGAGALVMPVVSIDGAKIGDGAVPSIVASLRKDYIARATQSAG